ncbi:hypothetical protein DACRYDRAFT_116587 [Dacryopinax primogenitus]|uniref:Uncharacterized protein n=1 Tax=Dacryopinax primogenitus (strain DJM 731) TaxID=1858805 RepID=M5FUJ4_DACPD|nr:uncharacterized protein DACRYDRAFT_116587 [Dacryopinax primogenitus]EJU01421.1 hypothetical protein DACRYDRAFT_116587 [Dacryopinax primogenitus]
MVFIYQNRLQTVITGPVYLYRPGDSDFVPKGVGYWNGLNSSDPQNTITCPDIHPKGYGYRVVIVPDRDSPARKPQHSLTFPIVSQSWLTTGYDKVYLFEPTSVHDDTKWSSTGKQLLAWQDTNHTFDEFDVWLHKSADVTWGPKLLTHVVNASCPLAPATGSCSAIEYYFEYHKQLPKGEGWQLVFQQGRQEKRVFAVSGLIEIVDSPVTTNTFPYSWTPIRTIASEATTR